VVFASDTGSIEPSQFLILVFWIKSFAEGGTFGRKEYGAQMTDS
jgi:hypothetical protein